MDIENISSEQALAILVLTTLNFVIFIELLSMIQTKAYILRREALRGNNSSPQWFQPSLEVNLSRLKLEARFNFR